MRHQSEGTSPLKTYIIRIYRFEKDNPKSLVGGNRGRC